MWQLYKCDFYLNEKGRNENCFGLFQKLRIKHNYSFPLPMSCIITHKNISYQPMKFIFLFFWLEILSGEVVASVAAVLFNVP